MNRRDSLKLAGLTMATTVIPNSAIASETKKDNEIIKKVSGKSVIIVGGGFGGLTMAKVLKKQDASIEVTVIEKNSIFISAPFSNALLGGLSEVSLETFVGDYYQPAMKYGYDFVNATVTKIDRDRKVVVTTDGSFAYDILVLSPGVVYDYERQFPLWSSEKIAKISQSCPAGLMSGNGFVSLKRQLDDAKDGNIVIVPPPVDKYKCPPAPYERASMVANLIKNRNGKGKVIILDTRDGTFAKDKAFTESWKDLYPDIIDYVGLTEVTDVDVDKKTITYTEFANQKDIKGVTKSIKYEVCNLMPINKCSPIIKMSGIDTDESGYALMDGYSFKSKTDNHIYVIGDAVTHAIPASGQTAIWSANRASLQIIAQLSNKVYDTKVGLPAKSANICLSMVGDKPEEAIVITHTIDIDGNGMLMSKGNVHKPKDGAEKYRSQSTAKATREWFAGVMRELFS